jgi:hypothetical protein
VLLVEGSRKEIPVTDKVEHVDSMMDTAVVLEASTSTAVENCLSECDFDLEE